MKIIPFLLALLINAYNIYGQSDAIKIAEARYALEKKNDCEAAKLALNEVSSEGKTSTLWILYSAKAFDCAKEYDNAIKYYTEYLKLNPSDAEIVNRVAELSYEKKRKELDDNFSGIYVLDDDPAKEYEVKVSGNSVYIESYTGNYFSGTKASEKFVGKFTRLKKNFSTKCYNDRTENYEKQFSCNDVSLDAYIEKKDDKIYLTYKGATLNPVAVLYSSFATTITGEKIYVPASCSSSIDIESYYSESFVLVKK